jgi:mannitol/fructose-specific phosphotransferase system IIA component (Ntr-type)
MRMSDFVVRDAIVAELAATNKEGVIREMVESLRAAGQFRGTDLEDIIRAILKREFLGSTGIGRGVAIPHTKHNSVERLVGTVALSHKGIAFDSLAARRQVRSSAALRHNTRRDHRFAR